MYMNITYVNRPHFWTVAHRDENVILSAKLIIGIFLNGSE